MKTHTNGLIGPRTGDLSRSVCKPQLCGMDIEVKPIGGVQFEVTARGHRITSDQPAENGGEDTGMTPPELMLASLGTCAAYYATEYLRTRMLDTCSLRIQVGAEKALKPARLSDFRIVIDAPAVADNEQHREGILRAVQNCLIHNTLLHSPHVETVLTQDHTVGSAEMLPQRPAS